MTGAPSGAVIAVAAQLACLLEASAPKPGNVSPGVAFHDTTYEDFLASAVAIGPAFARAGEGPLGATIRAAVEATARWAPSNTNLGLVLLLAPLARAALRPGAAPLRAKLAATLAETTQADAREAYAAIRLAAPGGLGRAPAQDVAGLPTVTLQQAMALAADRDAIAREYATDFRTTFETATPTLTRARAQGLPWREATLETYLTLLATAPDTHIGRKLGAAAAAAVHARAGAALAAGGVRTPAGRAALAALDAELRDGRNTKNPGATADLTAAGIFVVLLDGGWPRGGRTSHGRP
ncbi:MAG TPA: triphosphoribosyl-dephospho-CoA synthase [Gemmatimonadales bacterium]|nr:triphosphoribosyl-dephospho-CoA synthase [Gemmatimonadales bacterium]